MAPLSSQKKSPLWCIKSNYQPLGGFIAYFMLSYYHPITKQQPSDQTSLVPHLTLLKEKRNTKWSEYSATDVMAGLESSSISSNGRDTPKATTPGNQLTKSMHQT